MFLVGGKGGGEREEEKGECQSIIWLDGREEGGRRGEGRESPSRPTKLYSSINKMMQVPYHI